MKTDWNVNELMTNYYKEAQHFFLRYLVTSDQKYTANFESSSHFTQLLIFNH